MDKSAEFTLRVASIAQTAIPGVQPPERWILFPDLRQLTWDEMREALSRAPKPLCVAPLLEPGCISLHVGNPALQKVVANQVAGYREKLPGIGLREEDTLVLGTATGDFTWTVREFQQWLTEYVIVAHVVVTKTLDPRIGQILIIRQGEVGRPLNPMREQPPAEACDCGHEHAGHSHA